MGIDGHSPANTISRTQAQVGVEAEEGSKDTAAPSELKAQTEKQIEEKKQASENCGQTEELNEELAACSDAQIQEKPHMELLSMNLCEGRTTKTVSCTEVQEDFRETFENNGRRLEVDVKLQDGGECKTELSMSNDRLVSALKGLKEVFGLPALVAYIAKNFGYLYGVQYFSLVQTRKSRSSALLTGNLRCLRHKSQCRSNIRAKFYPMARCWVIEQDLIQTHIPQQLPSPDDVVRRRFEGIRSLASRLQEWEEHIRKNGECVRLSCILRTIPPFQVAKFYNSSSCYLLEHSHGTLSQSDAETGSEDDMAYGDCSGAEEFYPFYCVLHSTKCLERGGVFDYRASQRRVHEPKPQLWKQHFSVSQEGGRLVSNLPKRPQQGPISGEGIGKGGVNDVKCSDGLLDNALNVESGVRGNFGISSFEADHTAASPNFSTQTVGAEYERAPHSAVVAELGSKMSEESETLNAKVAYAQQISDEQSVEEEKSLLIDRFLDDEEEVPSCCFEDSDGGILNEEESESKEKDGLGEKDEKYWTEDGNEELGTESVQNTIPNERIEGCFKAAVLAYLETLPLNAPGFTVMKEVQFIAVCFGYNLFVRTSIYFGERKQSPDKAKSPKSRGAERENRRVLKKEILKCDQYNNKMRRCLFSITIKTEDSGQEEDGGMIYVANLNGCKHGHGSSGSFGMRHLKPQMRYEAIHMTKDLHMSFRDTIRYLEDKYSQKINPVSARNKLSSASSTSSPRDSECVRLCNLLFSLSQEDARSKGFFAADDSGRMKYACWSFRERMEDYRKFGIVPGVSIDCKAIANRYGFPLVTINGRANDGHVLTFFMGYMCSETEEDFVRILSYFKSIVAVSPAMVVMDQNTACINAAKNVFNSSCISLDEWYLNENQKKNVASWCRKIGKIEWMHDMKKDLFNFRKLYTSKTFFQRRRMLEFKYFDAFDDRLPEWYNYLYQYKLHIRVPCFRHAAIPTRYIFQGTGYTESSNSAYNKIIISKKIPLCKASLEVRLISQERADTRNLELVRPLSSQSRRYRKTRELEHFLPVEVVDSLVAEYTNYALAHFVHFSFKPSKNYILSSTEVVDYSQEAWPEAIRNLEISSTPAIGPVPRFKLKWGSHLSQSRNASVDEERSSQETVIQFSKRYTGSGDDVKAEFIGVCFCGQPWSLGFACRHTVRCAVVYQEEHLRFPELRNILGFFTPLETPFSIYWRKATSAMNVPYLAKLMSETR